MSGPDAEFVQMIELARQGNQQAIEQLVREYEPEVRLVAQVRLGAALRPYVDTVDLMQSVHGSLLLGLRHGRFDISTPEKLVALAVTIVRRKAARQWRKMRRQQRLSRHDQNDRDEEAANLPAVLATVVSTEADPLQRAQLEDLTRQFLNLLDETDRALVEMRLNGCSTAEVARELGLNADSLRVRLSRLRQLMREQEFAADWL